MDPAKCTLIVCKPTQLFYVEQQCIPRIYTELYHGAKRRFSKEMIATGKIVIATYNVVQSDFKKGRQDITSHMWHRIVLLDSQYLGSRPKTSEAILKGLHGRAGGASQTVPSLKPVPTLKTNLIYSPAVCPNQSGHPMACLKRRPDYPRDCTSIREMS